MSKQIAANRYAKKNPGRKVASWVPVPNRSNRNLTDYLIWKNFLMNKTKYIFWKWLLLKIMIQSMSNILRLKISKNIFIFSKMDSPK